MFKYYVGNLIVIVIMLFLGIPYQCKGILVVVFFGFLVCGFFFFLRNRFLLRSWHCRDVMCNN